MFARYCTSSIVSPWPTPSKTTTPWSISPTTCFMNHANAEPEQLFGYCSTFGQKCHEFVEFLKQKYELKEVACLGAAPEDDKEARRDDEGLESVLLIEDLLAAARLQRARPANPYSTPPVAPGVAQQLAPRPRHLAVTPGVAQHLAPPPRVLLAHNHRRRIHNHVGDILPPHQTMQPKHLLRPPRTTLPTSPASNR